MDYVGNPSLDSVAGYQARAVDRVHFLRTNQLEDKPILALVAGSRRQEIRDNLPTMLRVAARFPQFQAVIAGAPGIHPDEYKPFLGGNQAKVLFGQTYPLLQHSAVALVTSGTATLETALFRVPQVVCYYVKGGRLVNFVFRHFFHTPYISLVNLIAGREVVQELFGARFSEKNITEELERILTDKAYCIRLLEGYETMLQQLGKPGASARAASLIVHRLRS